MNTETLYKIYLKNRKICTDTRKITPGCIFFALKGPNFNGNRFADEALEKGAACVVVDEENASKGSPRFVVQDSLKALQELALHHRRQFKIPLLGITGSNGKTTTKELVHLVLSRRYRTHCTAGNFNNHIGVPLTLLAMPDTTEIAVIELGDNKPGDIAELCEIAEPTHGLVTNIGKDHIEGYGSFEGNIRTKSELFQYLRQHGGTAFIPVFDPVLKEMAKRFQQPVLFGEEGSFSHLQLAGAAPFVQYRDADGQLYTTGMAGKYNFFNVQAAACVGRFFEVPAQAMHQAICHYQPQNNRSQVVETGRNSVLLDAYNANPSSVELALESFAEMPSEKPKVVVLGDMLELGPLSQEEHSKMVRMAEGAGFEQCIFCGPEFGRFATEQSLFFNTRQEVADHLRRQTLQNCYVLLKGSRGLQLEKLMECL